MNFPRTSLGRLRGLGISLAALGMPLVGAQEAGPRLWAAAEPSQLHGSSWVSPRVFRAFRLDHAGMRTALSRAPKEGRRSIRDSGFVVSLPMPDGAMARFRCVESPIVEPELAARFPEISTFAGQGLDDPSATVRFDLTPAGLHAQILSPNGAIYIDPYFRGDQHTHVSYHKRDYVNAASDFLCRTASGVSGSRPNLTMAAPMNASGGSLRIYRLACAATGEYTAWQGGTVAAGMAAIVTAVNRVNAVYEADLGIRLVLVANNDQIVFTNPNLDPYSNYDGGSMLKQNQSTIDAIIGPANYDIGHVFSTGGGGMAYFGVVCRDGMKAGGVTGSAAPTGDAFWIDYVAHEMGHQFGANHTFNSANGACGAGNRTAYTAFEPGSGSTIMAYAGICGADNLQLHSDPYFHSVSIEEILNYVGSSGVCAGTQPTGNSPPLVSAGPAFVIPKGTPFVLRAGGSDPDGDPLTYCWEERDLGPAAALSDPDNGASPLFRSFAPVSASSRTFPRLASLLSNAAWLGEKLPMTSRLMQFRVVARDQHPGGGAVGTADTQVQVTADAGPFVVTSPNTSVRWAGVQTVTWSVAGTTNPPVSAGFVNIRLSTNAGADFSVLLASNVPNSGAQSLTLPQISNSTCRIMLEAAGNIFFDVSDANFTVVPAVPQLSMETAVLVAETCSPANNVVDPGETVLMSFTLRNTGSADTTNLVVSLVPTGQIRDPSAPQTYGRLAAGGAGVSGTFAFTSGAACGEALGAVLQLQDGAVSYGLTTNALPVAASNLPCCTGLAPQADLALGESIAPGVVEAGSNAVAFLSVTNRGPNAATNVVIRAALPPGLAYVGASSSQGSYAYTNDTILFTLGQLGYASSAQMNFTVAAVRPGQFTNSVLAASSTPDASSSDNAASVVLVVIPVNSPPALAPIPAFTIDEGVILTFTNFVTDPDLSAQSLSFALSNAPAGSMINPTNGVFSWVTSEADGPSTNEITVLVTDNGSPPFTSAGTFTVVVREINQPPVLPIQPERVVTVNEMLQVTNSATDFDLPLNSLSYQLLAGPRNAWIDTNGIITWTPDPSQAPSTNLFQVVVIDDNPWAQNDRRLSATNSFTVVVQPVHNRPAIPAQLPVEIAEGTTLVITNSAFATNIPALAFTYRLINPPAGMTINGEGVITWTPTEAQGPYTNLIETVVTDAGQPPLSSTNIFQVIVLEVNTAPALFPIGDVVIHAGSTLVISNAATDLDLPTNHLSFRLDPGAPSAMVIRPDTGLVTWTTTAADAGSSNHVSVSVIDDGIPPLASSHSFVVTVISPPMIQGITVSNGVVKLSWQAIPGQLYQVEYAGTLEQASWTALGSPVTATGPVATQTDDVAGSVPKRFYRVKVLP